MQEFSTGVLHFPRFAVPGKQINCQCLDDVKPVKSHYWMSPLRWWWLMHLFHHLPVPVPSSSVPSGTSPTSCARSAGPVLFRRPGSKGCTFYDPRVVLSQILIEVPEKVQPGPECLICGVERVSFNYFTQQVCCSIKWVNVWFWWSWNFVFSLGLFGQI